MCQTNCHPNYIYSHLLLLGESPSSSASDLDNLNHQATADKAASAKVVGSPQVSGSHIITSRNRASLLRVLNYVSMTIYSTDCIGYI